MPGNPQRPDYIGEPFETSNGVFETIRLASGDIEFGYQGGPASSYTPDELADLGGGNLAEGILRVSRYYCSDEPLLRSGLMKPFADELDRGNDELLY